MSPFGTVLLVMCNVLMGPRSTYGVALVSWVAIVVAGWSPAQWALADSWSTEGLRLDVLAVYGLVSIACNLSSLPLARSLGAAISGWQEARAALLETLRATRGTAADAARAGGGHLSHRTNE